MSENKQNAFEIDLANGQWIKVIEQKPMTFTIVGDSMTDPNGYKTDLGLSSWDEEVVDEDGGWSDEASCFGMSVHLRWNDVNIYPDHIEGGTLEEVKEAVKHVKFIAWDPGDI